MADAWRCTVCGYVAEGDAPPEVCPVCGVDETFFVREEGAAAPAPSAPPATDDPSTALEDAPERPRTYWRRTVPFTRRIAVVGGGVAALEVVRHARETDPEAAIALFHREPFLPYARLSLTRLMVGDLAEHDLPLQRASWYAENGVETVEGDVVAIDLEKRSLHLANGDAPGWDRLVLATGAHPFVPPIPGVTREGVHPLRRIADARAILARVRRGTRVVVLGGGLLGLEAAGAIVRRGGRPTVLEGAGWLLPRQLSRGGGEFLRHRVEVGHIAVRCGAKVESLLGDEAVSAVRLADGTEIPADLVVLATGVRPNADLARRAGLRVERGVCVDARMRTSDPDVFAAGDVAEIDGLLYGLWGAAFLQGRIAGANAADGDEIFGKPPPSTRLKVLAVDVFSIGELTGEGLDLREVGGGNHHAGYAFREDRLVGACVIDHTPLAETVRAQIGGTYEQVAGPLGLARAPGAGRPGGQGHGGG